MRFFFYGTLMDPALRALVLRGLRARSAGPARLAGYRRARVAGKSYPMLVADSRAAVDGVLVRGLPRRALARLDRYEGGDYRTVTHAVHVGARAVPARVYVAVPGRVKPGGAWSYEDWRRRAKAATLARIRRGLSA